MRRKDAVIGVGTRRVRWAYSDRNQICRELAQKKPWLSEALPELTSLSAQDICYGADAWCVIVAGKRGGDGKLEKGLLDTMIASKSKHASGSVKLAFMWVDADREKTFTSALGIESAPRVAVLRTRADEAEARAEDLRRRLRTAMTAREQAERRTRAVQQQLADSQRQVEIGKTQIMQLSQLTSARSA